jgi:tRNA (adenine22-N1)-methyltransferase
MLNKRLLAVSRLIEPCEVLMDVGSDHGFLPLYLLINRIVKHAIIGDVNQGPLDQAKKNFRSFEGLNATFVLSNGINGYTDLIDCVVIAGMGCETIQSIIQQNIDRFRVIPQIIIQSNTKIEILRNYLNNNNFEIIDESIIKDRKYYYPILKVKYDLNHQTLNEEELLYGPILIKNRDEVFINYLLFKKSVEEKIQNAQRKESSERIRLIDKILNSK